MKYELTMDAQEDLKLANTKKYDMVLFGTHAIGGWSTYHREINDKNKDTKKLNMKCRCTL